MSKQKYDDRIKKIVNGIKKASDELGIHPAEVTKAHFFKYTEDVSPWDLREVGGLTGVVNAHFPVISKDLATIRQNSETSKYIKTMEKKLGEVNLIDINMKKAIVQAVGQLKIQKIKLPTIRSTKGDKMTMELMLSDIHYGKKTETFNLKVCRERMQHLTKTFLEELARKKTEGYNVHRIIIALLGDAIESFTFHGLESAIGCEFGNAQQVQAAIQSLYHDIIVPIAKTGITIDIPSVTGNHDRTETLRTMHNPGENNLTWIIYNTLEELCKASGLKNVKFHIAAGSYIILNIYGNNCLYEHGDNCGAYTKKAFENLMEKRARQHNTTLHFGRFGHYHEYAVFDRGRIIVNESVCGQDSFAEVKGFKTSAGQTINYYVETKTRPNCFYYSFPVFLG